MSFTKSFQRKLRAVRVRCGVNLLLRQAGRVLAAGGGIAIPAVLVQQLLAVPVVATGVIWAFWGIIVSMVLVLWLLSLPSRMQASLLLDERLRLRERFSTTLALASVDDPFAKAARAESLRAIEEADVRGHFPIRLSRSWCVGAGTWLAAVLLLLYMPQKDLLGLLSKRQQQQEKTVELEKAKVEVQKSVEPVRALVERLNDPALERELEKLDELARGGEPQQLKREAIKALGDLAEKIQQMQGGAEMQAGEMLQRMLRQLRGSADPFSQQMRSAMAKGDFNQAASLLRELQNQLASGSIPEEQRQRMAEQLQQLAKELQKVAAGQRELEKEMERLGLDKKLAQLSQEQLRQALQKQGLSREQMEQLLQKLSACQSASGRCSSLAQALAACGGVGGLSAEELAGAIEQLDVLESLEQQAILLRAGLAEISRCIGGLGDGMCDGIGGQSPWREGESDRYGSGSGGPGRGYGPRDSDDEGQTGTKGTRAKGEASEGPVIASWYFKDMQVKGESRREFTEVVEAGRARAADAISENQIPRKYEDAVKKYFGRLEEQEP